MKRADLIVCGAAIALGLAALTTPTVPYEYDAAGWWLPRAAWERESAGTIIGYLRTPETLSLLQPWLGVHRHPQGSPMIVGALARLFPTTFPIARVAALWNSALLVALLIGIRRRLRHEEVKGVLFAVAVLACPFLFVHLRAGYVDLSVGAVAGLLVLALQDVLAASPSRSAWLRAVALVCVIVQLKLEGPIHAVSALLAVNLLSSEVGARRRFQVAAVVIAVVAVNLLAWQQTLQLFPAASERPALFVWNALHPGLLVDYAFQLLRHAIDFTTWGVVWAVVIGTALVSRRWAALASLLFTLGILGLAFAAGPPAMMVWAAQGIQLNRLLLQALLAALPLAAGIRPPVATTAGD